MELVKQAKRYLIQQLEEHLLEWLLSTDLRFGGGKGSFLSVQQRKKFVRQWE